MEFKEALQKHISIYWWNFGTRTLDFKGTYEEFFKQKGIKISKIKKFNGDKINGLRFKVPVGSCRITIDVLYSSWFIDNFDKVIQIFLSYLGDKAKLNGFSREIKINW